MDAGDNTIRYESPSTEPSESESDMFIATYERL